MSHHGLEVRLTELCGYNNSRYEHPCYSNSAFERCEAAPTCDRGFTATMCRAVDTQDTTACPICKWSCSNPTVECSSGVFLTQAACEVLNTCKLQSCPVLDLSSMSIQDVPQSLFTNISHIHELNLGNNSIRNLSALRFPVSLLTLDLSGNPVETIDEYMFCEAIYLQRLDVSATNGAFLALQHACSNALEYVLELSLAFNDIQDLSSSMLLNMRMLEKLNLRNNRLSSLPSVILESINASVCEDTPPFENGTYPWWSFESGCRVVQSITAANPLLTCNSNLSTYAGIGTSSNDIQGTFCDHCCATCNALGDPCPRLLQRLRVLHLEGNQISTIPPGSLRGLVSLRELYLDDNDITASSLIIGNTSSFTGQGLLETLSVSNCELGPRLASKRFSSLESLTTLDVSRNGIVDEL